MDDTERLVVLLEARVRDFEKNMAKASGTAGREFGKMRQDSRSATAAMEADMARSTSRMSQTLATFSTKIGAMSAAFAPVAVGVGAAGAALVGFGVQARQIASDIASIGAEAKRAGIDVKAFQELKYVADQNKVSIDALTDGLKEMNLRADEFIVTGKGSGAEAFQRLGLTATDLAKKLRDPSALLTEIIGKVEKMDQAAQIRIFDQLFGGTGGEQFVQLIAQGEAGIRRTIDEARALGVVMDEDLIQKAVEVDRQFNRISQTVGTTLKSAVVEVAHLVSGMIDGMRDVGEQQTATIQAQLGDIFEQRKAIQDRIAEMQQQDAEGFGFFSNANEIKLAQANLEKLTDEAARLKDILDRRNGLGAVATDSKAAADASQDLGDGLGYVARNGGAATATVDTYGKSVADLRSRLTGAVAELQTTIDTFGQSEGAIAAARFEADAMADALRAATAAGKDGVDADVASFIRGQAAEYGRLTDQISASTKAEQKRQEVLDKAKDRGDRISAFEADLAFERSILTLPEAEQRVRTTLRDLDVSYDSFEGQRIAGAMRYNSAIAEQQDELRRTGTIVEEMGDIFADIFSAATRDGENFFESVIRGISGLGNQLAAAGAKRLFGNVFGTQTANDNRQGALGYFAVGSPVGGNQSAASYAPAPTSDMRRTSAKLAEGVTESVSDTLLKNMLTAGKSEKHVTGLNREFATALTNMFSEAPAAVRSAVTIYSGFRSVERQAELFSAAVKKYGSAAAARKMVAPPGRSQHNHGNAADLDYGGSASAQKWVHQNASRYGLNFPMSYEDWHIERAGARGGTKAIEKATSSGVQDALKTVANDRWGGMREADVVPSATMPQMSRGQAGFGALAGIAGLFGSGYQSGNPVMGAISGAFGGAELASQFGSALGLGAMATPIGMGVGAIASPMGSRRQTGADFRRRMAAYHAKKEMTDDSRQRRFAA